ncbi:MULTISPECIES: hypothetical protein [unclassified Bradyrhizobium]|uniref:hypothetical protein n=1 Tax=unclassified Bradyrhizobium TaxID=2631580 RepID=UPI00070C2866|nr:MULTISPECIES: hypothetical protein [unclassified Bradyrhizobium]KQT21727.1 hypothetical protein ASG57_26755 [Bradyrhizobium sp. Leaf396]
MIVKIDAPGSAALVRQCATPTVGMVELSPFCESMMQDDVPLLFVKVIELITGDGLMVVKTPTQNGPPDDGSVTARVCAVVPDAAPVVL